MEMIKLNYMLEIDISRNSSPRKLGVLGGAFEGFGCPKRLPDALLAKTMIIIVANKHMWSKTGQRKWEVLYILVQTFDPGY